MIATAIILTGIGSYAMRAFFIFALARYAFPPLLLVYPACVLSEVAREGLYCDNQR